MRFIEARLENLKMGDTYDLEFTAEPVGGPGVAVPVSIKINGKNLLAEELLPSKQPHFSHFFIQFTGGANDASRSSVTEVKIIVE